MRWQVDEEMMMMMIQPPPTPTTPPPPLSFLSVFQPFQVRNMFLKLRLHEISPLQQVGNSSSPRLFALGKKSRGPTALSHRIAKFGTLPHLSLLLPVDNKGTR